MSSIPPKACPVHLSSLLHKRPFLPRVAQNFFPPTDDTNNLLFWLPGQEKQFHMKKEVFSTLTAWQPALSLKLLLDNPFKVDVQSNFSSFFLMTFHGDKQANSHSKQPITRSPQIIHKLLQCSPTSTWKFTLSELAVKNLSFKTVLH